jgi:hypothetical protein
VEPETWLQANYSNKSKESGAKNTDPYGFQGADRMGEVMGLSESIRSKGKSGDPVFTLLS